jgi:hypothetical protein
MGMRQAAVEAAAEVAGWVLAKDNHMGRSLG